MLNQQTFERQAMNEQVLDYETELRLARAWRDHRDEAAMHRLIAAYVRLAITMAQKFRHYKLQKSDLIQEANLGLMQAANKFDPDRGVRFSTYAMWRIRAALCDYVLHNYSIVRMGLSSELKMLFFKLRSVQSRLECHAMVRGEECGAYQLRKRISAELKVSLSMVEQMQVRMAGSDASLNVTLPGTEDQREWVDLLVDDAPQASEVVEAKHSKTKRRELILAAMKVLSDRERHIIIERWLYESPRTLECLGIELGISKERVRQIEVMALQKMRGFLESESNEEDLCLV